MKLKIFLVLVMSTNVCLAASPFPGNDSTQGTTAVGFPNTYTGNFSFSTKDLVVSGAVGEYGLSWMRHANSRTSQSQDMFGVGHNWAHNWQWELVNAGRDSEGRNVISLRHPEGTVNRFTEVSQGVWGSSPDVLDRVVVDEKEGAYIVRRNGGGELRFQRVTDSAGGVFELRQLVDSDGNTYEFRYSNQKLVEVTEPAGRWIRISYSSIADTTSTSDSSQYSVISQVRASNGQDVHYHYKFLETTDLLVLAGVTYPDKTQANYSYTKSKLGSKALLSEADDPQGDSRIRGRTFIYQDEPGAPIGQIEKICTSDYCSTILALTDGGNGLRSYLIEKDNGALIYETYNPGGNLAEVIDAEGFKKEFVYDSGGWGHLSSLENELGHITRYERNSEGYVERILLPDRNTRLQTYDDDGRILSKTDELGRTHKITRDAKGREIKIEYPDGSTEELSYNKRGQVLSRKNRDGGITTHVYDSRGMRSSTEDGLGNKTIIEYDEKDHIASVTDPRGNATKLKYNLYGQLLRITFPDGYSQGRAYSRFGELVKTQDSGCAGCSPHYIEYDIYGRRTKFIDSVGGTTRWEYAPVGFGVPFYAPNRIINPAGDVTKTEFDANGRPIARIVAAGTPEASTTRIAYDAAGRETSITGAAGKNLQLFHDMRGRVVTAMGSLKHRTEITYDAAGQKLSETDPKGNVTRWVYDSMGREINRIDAMGKIAERSYDSHGRIIERIDPEGNVYRHEYDLAGREVALIYPDGSKETSSYDEVGNKIRFTNRSGVVRTTTYDNRNREVFSEFSDGSPSIARAYDASGHLLVQDNGVSRLSYTYDAEGRLLSETQDLYPVATDFAFDPKPRTVSYVLNPNSTRDRLSYPEGESVSYRYNLRNQMREVVDENSMTIARYEYDLAGNATRMPRKNLTETALEFNLKNELIGIVEQGPRNRTISEFNYTYDEVGNRLSTSIKDHNGQTRDTYQYDETYQVSGANYQSTINDQATGEARRQVNFTYDGVGNRIEVNVDGSITRYTANSLNQYIEVGEFNPDYDGNGNLSAMGNWLYRYDSLNRMIEATDGEMVAKFFYDSRNRNIARIYNGEITLNTYDDWNLIEERDGSDQLKARYIHGSSIDKHILIANQKGVFYPHHDVLGNVTFLTDDKGEVVERYEYSVAGNVVIKSPQGDVLPSSAVDNRWMYTGREWLSEVGLYDYRNRMYSSELGRFLQTDPIRFRAGDINLYRYVSNRYTRFVDPSGLVCGNGTWGDWLIPDGIPGIFNAAIACGIHDNIYDNGQYNGATVTVGSATLTNGSYYSRSAADSFFLMGMLDQSTNIFAQTFSYIYYSAVRLFGWIFWNGE